MAGPGLDLETTFLVSIWVEGLVYGFFTSIFCISLYTNLKGKARNIQSVHSKNMFYIGIVMWIISTLHIAMNCFRMVEGYIVNKNFPGGGAAGWIGNLAPWHHIFKDTLYATQELLGDAAAIYRCYIVWQKNWKIILFPCLIFMGSITSGYAVCGLYSSFDPTATVFDSKLLNWITTFYSLAVVQNIITTGLLSYKIWTTDRQSSSAGRVTRGHLMPVLVILIESAAMQVIVEIVLLALYSVNLNVQYILLEMVTPVIGITFTAISLRITAQQNEDYRTGLTTLQGSNGQSGNSSGTAGKNNNIVVKILKNVRSDAREDEEIGMTTMKSVQLENSNHNKELEVESQIHHRDSDSRLGADQWS